MNKLVLVFSLIIMGFLISGAAQADCKIVPFNFDLLSNPTLDLEGTGDGKCTHQFTSNKTTFTELTVVKKPKHGKIEQKNEFALIYNSDKNFKGKDEYTLKLCGNSLGSKGCATLNYKMTVE